MQESHNATKKYSTRFSKIACAVEKGLNNKGRGFLNSTMSRFLVSFDRSIELKACIMMHRTELRSVPERWGIKVRCLGCDGREGNGGRNCGEFQFFMIRCGVSKGVVAVCEKQMNFASEWEVIAPRQPQTT